MSNKNELYRLKRAGIAALCLSLTLPAFADQYTQYYVRVSVDQVKIGYQRGKSPDRDYLTLYVTTTHDPTSRATAGPVDIGTVETNSLKTLSPNLMTDELLVGEADTIQIFADIQNKSHTDPSKAISDGLKIAGATIAVLGGGELLQAALVNGTKWGNLLGVEGGVVTLAGAVLALGGEVIGDVGGWFGLSDPDCDGPVFAPKQPVLLDTGKFMSRFSGPVPINTPLGIMLWSDDSQQNGDGCGHTPSATIRLNLILTKTPVQAPTLTSAIGVATHFRPVASGFKADSLSGTHWGDMDILEKCRVQLSIVSGNATGHSGATAAVNASKKEYFTILRRENPHFLDLLGQTPASGSAINTTSLSDRMTFDVSERLALGRRADIQISGASSVLVPMQATSFQGNTFPSAIARVVSAPAPGREVKAIHIRSEAFEQLVSSSLRRPIMGAAAPQSTFRFADSIALPDNVTLQLYGAFDAQERYVGARIRYLRVDGSGSVVTDAMLQPAQPAVR